MEIALVVGALVAGFAAGWLLASRNRATHELQLRDTFQALAASTLKASTDEFLKLADQKIGNVHREAAIDLTRRQQELGSLVTPIRDTLVQVDAKLKEVEKSRGYIARAEGVNQAKLEGGTSPLTPIESK